jgi:galactokinase
MDRLIGVLEREIDMVRAMKPMEIQSLQQEKIVLSAAYEGQLKAIADQPDLVRDLTPALRAQIDNAVDRFRQTLAENERSLRAAKAVTERVLQMVAEELDKARRDKAAYSAAGAVPMPTRTSAARPLSVAIDQQL